MQREEHNRIIAERIHDVTRILQERLRKCYTEDSPSSPNADVVIKIPMQRARVAAIEGSIDCIQEEILDLRSQLEALRFNRLKKRVENLHSSGDRVNNEEGSSSKTRLAVDVAREEYLRTLDVIERNSFAAAKKVRDITRLAGEKGLDFPNLSEVHPILRDFHEIIGERRGVFVGAKCRVERRVQPVPVTEPNDRTGTMPSSNSGPPLTDIPPTITVPESHQPPVQLQVVKSSNEREVPAPPSTAKSPLHAQPRRPSKRPVGLVRSKSISEELQKEKEEEEAREAAEHEKKRAARLIPATHWLKSSTQGKKDLGEKGLHLMPNSNSRSETTVQELKERLQDLDNAMQSMNHAIKNIQSNIPKSEFLTQHPGTKILFDHVTRIHQDSVRVKKDLETQLAERTQLKAQMQADSRKEFIILKYEIARLDSHSLRAQRVQMLEHLLEWMSQRALKLSDVRKYATDKSLTQDTLQEPTVVIREDRATQNTIELDGIGILLRKVQSVKNKESTFKTIGKQMRRLAENVTHFTAKLEVDLRCPVCDVSLTNAAVVWPCGHCMCEDCITKSFINASTLKCPECRCVTQDGMVPNVPISDLAAKWLFRSSGFNDVDKSIVSFLQDVDALSSYQATEEEIAKLTLHALAEQKKREEESARLAKVCEDAMALEYGF